MKGDAADLKRAAHEAVAPPIYHLLTLRFAIQPMRERLDGRGSWSSKEGSMIVRTAEATWGAAQLMLNPGYLIDKFLDWLDEVGDVLELQRLSD
jgi:hypothetical protein